MNPDVIFCDTLQATVPNPMQLPVDIYKKEQIRALLSPQAQMIHLGTAQAAPAVDITKPTPPSQDVPMVSGQTPRPSNQQAISPGVLAAGTWGAPLLPGMQGTGESLFSYRGGCVGVSMSGAFRLQ